MDIGETYGKLANNLVYRLGVYPRTNHYLFLAEADVEQILNLYRLFKCKCQ